MIISKLITGGDQTMREKRIDEILDMQNVSAYDRHKIFPQEKTNRIGIASIKKLTNDLFLHAVKGNIKAGVVYDLHRATPEAQNALLKLVEEPDEHTILLATAESKDSVLTTISSRCLVEDLNQENALSALPTSEEKKEVDHFFSESSGKRLERAEMLGSDTAVAVSFIEKAIKVIRYQLVTNPDSNLQSIQTVRTLERARLSLLNTNTNARLLLENLFLELPHNRHQTTEN